ncbi:uncharacterized protein LOC119686203 [Teleopsis dalmanni]|nr:uncharacterized protein LOC119686203 [Teleopsis dalmanni]
MSLSTTLTLSPVSSTENLQQTQFYQTPSKNSGVFYNFTRETIDEKDNDFLYNPSTLNNSYMLLPTEDTQLLEKAPNPNTVSISLSNKSGNYSSTLKTKSTIIKQDSSNGRIATSLTDSDSDSSIVSGRVCCPTSVVDAEEEQEAFLIDGPSPSTNTPTRRSLSKKRNTSCYRMNAFLCRTWYLNYIVPLSILLALMFVAYLTRDYAKRLLYWIETQNPWVIFALFIVLFIVVSFPIVVGYFVLMITAGYLFGFLKGFLTVILGANLGIAIAHLTIRSFRHRIPMHK